MSVYNRSVLDGSSAPQARWELYRVLAEPVRLKLLALASAEELAIGELAGLLGESQPNVSRHLTPLKQAGLVLVRREGARGLVRMAAAAAADAVVADALASGYALCEADGSLARIKDVLRERDQVAREFFAKEPRDRDERRRDVLDGLEATAAHVAAIAMLLPRRGLAVDAGTGDGALLDVLAPSFDRVVAVDRSGVQLERAQARVTRRGFSNVSLLNAELGAASLREHVGDGADVVFASRLLHHAPRPVDLIRQLAQLARPAIVTEENASDIGGAVVIVDYAPHEDESMRDEADLWLGFAASELARFAREADLENPNVVRLPAAWCGKGRDSHLPWQVMVARRRH